MALARATWAAASAWEGLMRTSQSRSWSVSFRRGSFLRRVIGKPPREEVEQLAAYPSFAEITTSMTSDSLGRDLPDDRRDGARSSVPHQQRRKSESQAREYPGRETHSEAQEKGNRAMTNTKTTTTTNHYLRAALTILAMLAAMLVASGVAL